MAKIVDTMSVSKLMRACSGDLSGESRLSAFRDVVKEDQGTCVEIGWPHCEMVVGDQGYFGLNVDLDVLRHLPCMGDDSELVFIGLVRSRTPFPGEGRGFGILGSSAGSVYAYSFGTGLLYVVTEDGFGDVINHHRGLRTVFEFYDASPLNARDEALEFGYDCCPAFASIMSDGCDYIRVADFVLAHPGLTCGSRNSEDRFVFGNEDHFDLAQYVPAGLIHCLKVAGYRVLGQGVKSSIIVYNKECQIFMLLRDAKLMKVGNTVRGFIRHRLGSVLDVRRRVFDPRADVHARCIGEIVTFPCGIRYVLQNDNWFHERVTGAKVAYEEACRRRDIDGFIA